MKYKSARDKITGRLLKQRARLEAVRRASPLSAIFALDVFAQQKTYLAWTGAGILLQLAEIAVLARTHYIFFPPSSLVFLRVLSALSVLGVWSVICAKAIAPPRRLIQSKNQDTEREFIVHVTQFIFAFTQIVALLVLAYVWFVSRLHYSTPTIYRAVLISNVLTFPFDVASTFLLYNAGVFKKPSALGLPRSFSWLSSLIALVFIALDLPSLYLAFRIVPRILQTRLIWKNASELPFRRLFAIPVVAGAHVRRRIKLFFFSLGPSIAFQLSVELSLFLAYQGLIRADSSLALLLFFFHKTFHLALVLGLKTSVRSLRELRTFQVIGDRVSIHEEYRKILITVAIHAGSALLILPLLSLKQQIQLWASPVGEYFEVSWLLIAVLSVLVLSSATASVVGSTLSGLSNSRVTYGVAIAAVTAKAFYLRKAVTQLLLLHTVTNTFKAYVAADSGVMLAVAAWFVYRGTRASIASVTHGLLQPFSKLWEELSDGYRKPGHERTVVLIELWPEAIEGAMDPELEGSLTWGLPDSAMVTVWGKRCCFILLKGSNTVLQPMLDRQAGLIRDLRVLRHDSQEPAKFLAELLGSSNVEKRLYELGSSKATPLPAGRPIEIDAQAIWLKKRGCWNLTTIADPDIRDLFMAYLELVSSLGEHISPRLVVADRFAGVVPHYQQGRLESLVWLPESARLHVHELRTRSFHALWEQLTVHP